MERDDIEHFMHAVAEGKTAARVKTGRHGLARVSGGQGTATRTLGLLGAIFAYAVRHRMRPDNPVHGVERFADGRRELPLDAVPRTAGTRVCDSKRMTSCWRQSVLVNSRRGARAVVPP